MSEVTFSVVSVRFVRTQRQKLTLSAVHELVLFTVRSRYSSRKLTASMLDMTLLTVFV